MAGGLLPALRFVFPAAGVATVSPAKIDLTTAPTHPFDAADGRLREAASVFQRALSAPTVGSPLPCFHKMTMIEIYTTYTISHYPTMVSNL